MESKKKISDKIRALLKPATPTAPVAAGQSRPQSPLSKEYSQMKMEYCSKNPPGGKLICSTAASQYKTAGAQSTRPSASSSPVSLSASEVWAWYCARPKQTADSTQLCENQKKRSGILEKLRKSDSTSEARKSLLEQLKVAPTAPFATTQAVYADFCKVPANSEKMTCTRLKATMASTNMRKWYCAKLTSTSSNWCKRQEILEKMQKIHYSTTDTALAQERKSLAAQYSEFSKPASGGGPSKMSLIAKEISDAKKQYCEQEANKSLGYCKGTRS
jgi:hypothetical protein